jgi:GAF domain-containing protein
VGSRGRNASALAPISCEEGVIGDVCLTGVARVLEPEQQRNPHEPIAVLPLLFASEVVGVIVVHRMLEHKRGFLRVDRELFKLLATQGATALIAANLYAKEAGPRAALHDIVFHLETERLRQLTDVESDRGSEL